MGGNGATAGDRLPISEVPTPTSTVHIALLGPLAVTVDGTVITDFGRTQRRLIVALALAAAGGTRTDIGELVALVYGEERPPKPRRSLATLVWRLRRDWGAEAICSDRYHYWLSPDCCTLDVTAFEDAVRQGRDAAAQARTDSGKAAADARSLAVTMLRQALSCWRTNNTADIAVPAPERDRLVELRLGASEQLATLLAEAGDHRAAVDLLMPIVAEHPDWEHSAAALIASQRAIGDGDGARYTFEAARRALLAEGVEPGPELAAAAATSGHPDDATPHGATPATHGATRDTNTDGAGALIGRQRERDLLVGAILSALGERRPTAVIVSGEAGIGKSTLVQTAVIDVHAHRDARVVTMHCDRRSTLPYAPLQALVNAVPDGALAQMSGISTGAHPIDDAANIDAATLADVTSLARDGLILVVEDAQYVSHETTLVFTRLLERCGALPLAIVATTRTPHQQSAAERATDDDNAAEFAALADRHLALTGLDAEDVAHMAQIDPTSARAAQLHRLTGGNPLFVRQIQHLTTPGPSSAVSLSQPLATTTSDVAQLLPELPADLTAAIEAHLAQIPSGTLAALRTAAAIGDLFDLMTLAALTGEARRSLAEWQDHVAVAIRHGLVRPDGDEGQFRFTHALIAAHLYGQLTPQMTAMTHAAIAAALQRISIVRPCPPDLLAHHCALGWPQAPTRDVVQAHLRAAEAVGAQLNFAKAADYYRTALTFLALDPQAVTPQQTAEILGAAAGASAAAGDLDTARELYTSQERVAAEAGLTRPRIFAGLGALRIAFLRRSHPRVADSLADALAESVRDENLADYLDLAGDALGAVAVYRPDRARELLASFAAHGPDVTIPLRLAIWEHQPVPEQLATARELASRAAEPHHQVAAWLRLWVSEVASGRRRFDDAPEQPVPLSAADDQTVFDLDQWRITRHITAGRFARARALIGEALAATPHPDPAERARRAVSFYGQSLYLSVLTGEPIDPADSPVTANPTWMTRHPIMRYVRTILSMRGEPDPEARAMVDELVDELADGDIPDSDIGPRLIVTTSACRQVNHRHGLQVCLDGLRKHRGEQGIFRFGQYWGGVDESLGEAWEALGEPHAAEEAYRAAIEGLHAVAAQVHLPGTQMALARVLRSLGRPGDRSEIESLEKSAAQAYQAMGLGAPSA